MTQDDFTIRGTEKYKERLQDDTRGSRHANAPPNLFDPNHPRIGRRESEPHSAEVSYLFDVLQTNFPTSRVI